MFPNGPKRSLKSYHKFHRMAFTTRFNLVFVWSKIVQILTKKSSKWVRHNQVSWSSFFKQNGGASCLRVYYQRGLPRLVLVLTSFNVVKTFATKNSELFGVCEYHVFSKASDGNTYSKPVIILFISKAQEASLINFKLTVYCQPLGLHPGARPPTTGRAVAQFMSACLKIIFNSIKNPVYRRH